MSSPRVVVLDHGSGNVHSAVRALSHVGAQVELTADRAAVLGADGLLVPGVGNFHACMAGLRAVDGPSLVDTRLAGGRPVLGVCTIMISPGGRKYVVVRCPSSWSSRTLVGASG